MWKNKFKNFLAESLRLSNSVLEKRNDDLMQEMMKQISKAGEVRARHNFCQKVEHGYPRNIGEETRYKSSVCCMM